MQKLHRQSLIGLFAILLGAFMVLVAIPNWVSAPDKVPHIVLSPLFWPYTIAGLIVLCGIGLFLSGQHSDELFNEDEATIPGAITRVLIFAVIAMVYVRLIPLIGMVWVSILAFAATAFLLRPGQPRLALLCAVLFPLILYVFFAHIAGVAIPQGQFVRLP